MGNRLAPDTLKSTDNRLLVFDCHEAWVYQLRALSRPMNIIVGLAGRHTDGWDGSTRPVPPNTKLLRLEEALQAPQPYDCIVAHNLSDLLDSRSLTGPRLLVLHETLDGTIRNQGSTVPAEDIRRAVAKYVRVTATHVVAVSKLKGRSWGFADDIVLLSADTADYQPWQGDLACGLRVANHIARRPQYLLWDFHQRAFSDLPITLVGHNPGLEDVKPSTDWTDLKKQFSRHRFYIHTADPKLEDGYNMATLEAMAAGLPVLGNRHPTSPIEHGVSGFLSNDPSELRDYAKLLLGNRDLAAKMGEAARDAVAKRFSGAQFQMDFARSIEAARLKWQQHQNG